MAAYRLFDGRIVFASKVLGESYCTVSRKPNGSLRRYKSPALPIRDSFEAAIADLVAEANRRGWPKV